MSQQGTALAQILVTFLPATRGLFLKRWISSCDFSLEEHRSPLDGEIPILHVGTNEDAPGLLFFNQKTCLQLA